MLLDEFLPLYDVSDSVAVTIDADAPTTWNALVGADLIGLGKRRPLIAALGALRMAPELALRLVRGEKPPPAPEHLTLLDTAGPNATNGTWILLGERECDEIALGLVGKFWLPVIEYAAVTPEAFAAFAEPGWAKTVYSLSVRELPDGRTQLAAAMRTATTDDHARRWFRRYWTLGVGSGAHVLVAGLLDVVREAAESAHAGAVT